MGLLPRMDSNPVRQIDQYGMVGERIKSLGQEKSDIWMLKTFGGDLPVHCDESC